MVVVVELWRQEGRSGYGTGEVACPRSHGEWDRTTTGPRRPGSCTSEDFPTWPFLVGKGHQSALRRQSALETKRPGQDACGFSADTFFQPRFHPLLCVAD